MEIRNMDKKYYKCNNYNCLSIIFYRILHLDVIMLKSHQSTLLDNIKVDRIFGSSEGDEIFGFIAFSQ